MTSMHTMRMRARGALSLCLLLCLPACAETRLATKATPIEVTETRERAIDESLLVPGKEYPRDQIATNGDIVDALEHDIAEIRTLNCQLDRIGQVDRGYCPDQPTGNHSNPVPH